MDAYDIIPLNDKFVNREVNIRVLNSKTADMHTHSESSHDSVCRIEDMYTSQLARGTEIFAVTDHFDTASYDDYDVFAPIVAARDTVRALNEKHGNENILAGVEISEGFWYPKQLEKILKLTDYDVIIGSVHLVRYRELTRAYSSIDFSCLSRETVVEYLKAYFDDMMAMLDTTDFDILAHLTCPLRYINGKYALGVSAMQYSAQIDEILRRIIKKGIALEVNTSSYDMLGDFMPAEAILQKYYDMGGYLLTLGSDAHIAENSSVNFDKAIAAVRKIGFDGIYYYRNRKPHKINI